MPSEAETDYNEIVYGGQNYIENTSVDVDPYADEIADGTIVSDISISRHIIDGRKLNDVTVDGQIHAVNVPDDLITNIISNLVCPVNTSIDEEPTYRTPFDDADEID